MRQRVPTLYTDLTAGADAANALVYGTNSIPYVLKRGDIVEIIVNNDDPGKHPFHLHGHNFQVVERSEEEAGFFNGSVPYDFPAVPVKRGQASRWCAVASLGAGEIIRTIAHCQGI